MLNPNIPKRYRDKDITSLPPWWKEQFEAEVKDGNFMDGDGTPLLVRHKTDPVGHVYMWMNCLHLAGYKCVCVSVYEVVNFMAQKNPVLSDVGGWEAFEEASTFFLHDFFTSHPPGATETFLLYAFMQQVVSSGQCIILATTEGTKNLDVHGDFIANLIEQKFEAINGVNSEEAGQLSRFSPQKKRLVVNRRNVLPRTTD